MRAENSDDEAAGSEQDLLPQVIVLIDTVGPAPGVSRKNPPACMTWVRRRG